MRNYPGLKVTLFVFLICGASAPLFAASDTNQQTRASILADKAIELATVAETDNPADPLLESEPEPEPSKPSKSFNSEFSRNYKECIGKIAVYGLMPITAAGADGTELSILTSVFGTVFCVPVAGTVATIEPSTKGSVEATSRKNQTAYRKSEQHRFIALTGENLVGDMARGGGEYLTTMAYLEGCPVEVYDSFARMTQRNFRQIIPQVEIDTAAILHNLEAQIAKDPLLARKCKRVS